MKYERCPMKAVQTEGGKIKLVKEDKSKIMEKELLKIHQCLNRIKRACVDRSTVDFPHTSVKEMIEISRRMIEHADDLEIPAEYLSEVVKTKDVARYFDIKIEEYENEEKRFIEKRRILNEIAEELEREIEK